MRSNSSFGQATSASLRGLRFVLGKQPDRTLQLLVKTAMRQLQLTARAYHRVLKLSRRIADLYVSKAITQVHLAEALRCRPKLDFM